MEPGRCVSRGAWPVFLKRTFAPVGWADSGAGRDQPSAAGRGPAGQSRRVTV